MNIRVRHILLVFSLVLITAGYKEIIDIYRLLFLWVSSVANGDNQELTLELADYMISALLVTFLLVFSLVSKSRVMNFKPVFPAAVLLILFLSALTAPLFTGFNADFQKNISVTKLLPPFSSKYFIMPAKEPAVDYSILRKRVVHEDLYEIAEIADSISYDGSSYYQGEVKVPFNNEEFTISTVFYFLGTDELGRDIFTRLIYGTRISLTVGLFAVAISLITGLLLGFLAGYYEGWSGAAINRVTDLFLSFPSLFLIILILALFGNSILSVIIVLGFTGWMPLFKIIRSEVISLRSRDYFITASALGLPKRTLIFKEMLPVVIVPVINNLVILFGSVIVAEASLSYIGLGTGMMYPSWGSMIDSGQEYMRSAWWMILMPGLFMFITLFSANGLGKKVRSFYNPRLK